MGDPVQAGYVLTESGDYLIQLPDQSQWGFSLCDGDQGWPGGFGIADSWVLVEESQVPPDVKGELGWILEEFTASQ